MGTVVSSSSVGSANMKRASGMIIILMGVVGAGKTTIGRLLAAQLGWEFADADDYHPEANVKKIRRGIPLNDLDRMPWLRQLRAAIMNWQSEGRNGVLACSALKKGYRDELTIGDEVHFVYLRGSADVIAQRLRLRKGHFADDQILASQFADLEEPESAATIDVAKPVEQIVTEIRKKLGLA
jgi:gluconokinase